MYVSMLKDLFVQFYGQFGWQVIQYCQYGGVLVVAAYYALKAWTLMFIDYIYSQEYLLLEIKLPRELTKRRR